MDHDKSQAILLDNGKYGISLEGDQGPLEDVREQVLEGDMQLLARFKNFNVNPNIIDPFTNKPVSKEVKLTSKRGEILFSMVLRYKTWKIQQLKNRNDPKEMESIKIKDYPNITERTILSALFK